MSNSKISSSAFYNIGNLLINSASSLTKSQSSLTKSQSSLTKSQSSLTKSQSSLTKSQSSVNELNDELSYSDDEDYNICNSILIEDNNTVYIDEITLNQYDIQLTFNTKNDIKIKIINLSTFKYYTCIIDNSYLQDKPFISSLNILYSLLYDAITKKHKNIVKIEFKIINDSICNFELIYNTTYDKYNIKFDLQNEIIDENKKKDLIIHYLIQNNLQLTKKVNELDNRLLKVELL